MHLSFDLAGATSIWYLPGGAQLQAWLRQGPWRSGGGLRILLVPNALQERISGWLVRELRGGTTGERDLEIEQEILGPGETVREGLARALTLAAPERDRYRFSDQVARTLQQHRVAILRTVAPLAAGSIAEAGGLLVEVPRSLAEWGGRGSLTCLILMSPPPCPDPTWLDLSYGVLSSTQLLSAALEDQAAAFSMYVQMRLAWEFQSRFTHVLRWGAEVERQGVGDDDGLEALLNRAALALFDTCDEATRADIEAFAAARCRRPLVARALGERLQAGESSAVIPRPGLGDHELAPWAARALLLRGSQVAMAVRSQLRARLVCEPLAVELLASCFAQESRQKAAHANVLEGKAGVRERESLDEFQDGRSPGRAFYPAGCPAVPDRVADFVSLGRLTHLLGRLPGDLQRREVALVRNLMSHGHYVCWKHVQRLAGACRSLEAFAGSA